MKTLSGKFLVFFMCATFLWLVSCSKKEECPTCPKHPATLYLSVHKIDFSTTGTSATFDIKNTGEESLSWTITTSGANWFTTSPTSGTNNATITVTAQRDSIKALEQQKAKVYVTAGSLKDSVEVLIQHGGAWEITPQQIDFGTTQTDNTFDITNKGQGTLNWTITTSGANWLTIFPTTGSNNATISVTAHRNLLTTLGQYTAQVYVTAGLLKDTVDVSIRYGGKWLTKDDGSYEGCLAAQPEYLWVVNRFNMPDGINRCFVDSVKINFCEAGPIRLRAFNASWDFFYHLYWPDEVIVAQPGQLQGQIGWNTFKVNWYVTTDPFFVGYYQPDLTTPDLNYDDVTNDTTSYVYDNTLPGWSLRHIQVFYIRIYVTAIPNYAPKIAPDQTPLDLTPRERDILSNMKKGG
jgi:Fe-S cluster assembly iron-binding protein IscA